MRTGHLATWLPTALTLEEPSDKRLLLLHECRHTRKVQGEGDAVVNTKDVQAALKKVRSAFARAGEETPLFAIVFVSNRVFKNATSKSLATDLERANLNSAIVIVRENCVDYYVPSLAPRFMGYQKN